MNKLGIVERDGKTVGYLVRSPATGALLLFYTNPEFSPCVWTFNGDMERPTFSPSMLLHPDNIHGREHFSSGPERSNICRTATTPWQA